MARAPFRLARLKRVRELEEELARTAWARAERRANDALQHVEVLVERHAAARRELGELTARPRLSPGDVLAAERVLETHAAEVARGRREASERRAEADALRAPWEAARAALLGLERLEQRTIERHRREQGAREASELDEVAGRRASARTAGTTGTRNRS